MTVTPTLPFAGVHPPPAQVAKSVYQLGTAAGLSPGQAQELVAAAAAESGLNPLSINPESGAAGLFQLLSSGYRRLAERLGGPSDPYTVDVAHRQIIPQGRPGGLFSVEPNTRAILPSYVQYFQSHPNAAPGEAGAAVEASGEPASFYAAPLSTVRGLLSSSVAQPPYTSPAASSYPNLNIPSGVDVEHVSPTLLERVQNLLARFGLTGTVTSGYRARDQAAIPYGPHARGLALDLTVGGKPIGDVLPVSTIEAAGLRSGAQSANFDPVVGRDPMHVDLMNRAGTAPMPSVASGPFGPDFPLPPGIPELPEPPVDPKQQAEAQEGLTGTFRQLLVRTLEIFAGLALIFIGLMALGRWLSGGGLGLGAAARLAR